MAHTLVRSFVLLAAFGFAAALVPQVGSAQDTADGDRVRSLTREDIARMLPATGFGSSDAGLPQGHPTMTNSSAPPVNFAVAAVAQNPLVSGATPVGAQTCEACHRVENLHASHASHMKAFRAGAYGTGPDATCEACHGPGSKHITNPAAGNIIAFTRDGGTPIDVQAATCLSCHAGGARQHWAGSMHQSRELSCTDCHNPMSRSSAEGALVTSSINEVCATCHQDIRARFNRRSHMPLPEGQMACTDCHNPHGSITRPLLKTDTVNETCYACHAERRGPMLFEHAPVRANCLNCHDPHGSNQQTLLTMPLPMLCQQCHTMTRHPNDLQTMAGLAGGPAPDERLIGRSCLTCHTNIHGSNNPSGPAFHK